MVIVENVSISFGAKVLFEDASFTVGYGEKIGLIGRNGTGKSTFLKMMLNKIEPDSGTIEIPSYYTIGYLEQHIHFEKQTVLEEVASVLPLDRAHEEWKGEMILQGLGFSNEQLLEDPNNLSGGWQIKVNLAKLLLAEPSMLLLDEPTNYLDIYSIRWLGKFLKEWEGELILITHDRSFMDSIINHTLIIHRGKFRKMAGTTKRVKEQIATEEEIYEKTRQKEEEKKKEIEDWVRRFGAKANLASQAKSRMKQIERMDVKVKLTDIANLDFDFTYSPYGSSNEMLQIKNLTFGYDKENILINNLSFKVDPEDKICIIGRNGNGKSTLLKLMTGELEPLNGTIFANSKVEYGYFGQMNLDRLNLEHTIVEELETVEEGIEIQKVRRTAAQMLFSGDDAFKKIKVLSGGERSRVMLGKILLTPSNLLLLDEPTNHFDMESSESLMDAIKNFPGAILMVTHNEYFLREIANKLVVFDGGKTFVFTGSYDDFLKQVGWEE
jgi:ATP-binding cassette, subfamily F, member 3